MTKSTETVVKLPDGVEGPLTVTFAGQEPVELAVSRGKVTVPDQRVADELIRIYGAEIIGGDTTSGATAGQ